MGPSLECVGLPVPRLLLFRRNSTEFHRLTYDNPGLPESKSILHLTTHIILVMQSMSSITILYDDYCFFNLTNNHFHFLLLSFACMNQLIRFRQLRGRASARSTVSIVFESRLGPAILSYMFSLRISIQLASLP